MGRPSITGTSIVIGIDADLLVWTDGQLSGTNKDLIAEAQRVALYEFPVDLTIFGPEIPAALNIVTAPERAVAAMVGAAPGRARILQAPQEVLDMLPFKNE